MPMQIYGFNNNYLLLTIMSMICSNVVVSYEWLISFTWDQRCHHLYKKFVILPYFLYCFFNSNTRVLMIVYSIFLELFVFCSVCMKQCCLFNAYFYEQQTSLNITHSFIYCMFNSFLCNRLLPYGPHVVLCREFCFQRYGENIFEYL